MQMGTSISLRVGSGNLDHNKRGFVAQNVDSERIKNNIVYKNESLIQAYNKLFSKAIDEHDRKQKQPCRRYGSAENYLLKIAKGKQEKVFQEVIVQFGNKDDMGVGTKDGEIAKKMLDEYMRNFQKRNPNLYVFSAVMHCDEASYHLHIDYIPFATKQQRGLSTRVTHTGAFIEQGLVGKNYKDNVVMKWAMDEKKVMAEIAEKYGIEIENKGIHRKYFSVEEYKEYAEAIKNLKSQLKVLESKPADKFTAQEIEFLQAELSHRIQELNGMKSEYKTAHKLQKFHIPDEDKLSFILSQLDKHGIDFEESVQGFAVSKIHEGKVREIEKSYKPKQTTHRERVREDIDRLIYSVSSLDELLDKLRHQGYEVKRGKYISLKPNGAERAMRTRSLGDEYTEENLIRRISMNRRYENQQKPLFENSQGIEREFLQAEQKIIVLFYKQYKYPHKKNPQRAWTMTNDYHIKELADCLKIIRENGVPSGEVLAQKIESLNEKISMAKERIKFLEKAKPIGEDVIKKAEFYFKNINTANQMTKLRLASIKEILDEYNISRPEHIEIIRQKLLSDATEKENLLKEIAETETEFQKYGKLNEIYQEVKCGNYVQQLVNLERERWEKESADNAIRF